MPEIAPRERLPWKTKLSYGLGDTGNSLFYTVVQFFFLYFLTDVARLDPALAGLALLVGKIWDAINDPLMGMLTDRTRTRWGRRRVYFLLGAIPYGLAFLGLWFVPPFQSQRLICLYYTFAFILYDAMFTLVCVPYDALIPELTLDYDERTSLISYRMAISIGVGLLGAVLPPLFWENLFPKNVQLGFLMMASLCAIVGSLPWFIVFWGVREREEFQTSAAAPLRQVLHSIAQNRAFLLAAAIYLLSWLAVDIVSAVLIYFLKYWLRIPGDISLILGLIFISAILFLPLWVKISEIWGKRIAQILGVGSWILVQMALIFVRPGGYALIYTLAILAGAGVSCIHIIIWAIVPDVVDLDELQTGKRQEGVYFGVFVFLKKLSSSLGLFLMGQALKWSGYIQPTDALPFPVQPQSVLNTIRLLTGPIPALLLFLSAVAAWYYPITRERHQEIRRQLAARRATTEAT